VSAQILSDGEGTHTVQISDRNGLVVMHFEKPVRWCALDPSTASRFAEAFARAAYKARAGDTPTTEKRSQITEQLRVRMVRRVELMLGSFAREVLRPELKVQATQIVDEIFKEVA
jgi:hypothetical protein